MTIDSLTISQARDLCVDDNCLKRISSFAQRSQIASRLLLILHKPDPLP